MTGLVLRIVDLFRRVRRRKRLARASIIGSDIPLREGLWIVGQHFSRHVSVQAIPAPLNAVKKWGGWYGGATLRTLYGLITTTTPPWFVYRRRGSTSPYSCDIVLLNRMKRLVGFDLQASKVVRRVPREESSRLRHSFNVLSPFYPCVPFDSDEEGGLLVEPMVDGHAFNAAGPVARAAAFETLQKALTKAVPVSPTERDQADWRKSSLDMVHAWATSDIDRVNLCATIEAIIAQCKWCWVHGDLFAENIIVTTNGPVLIDYDKAVVAPAFTELMTLAVFEARNMRPDVLSALWSEACADTRAALRVPVDSRPTATEMLAMFFAWLGWKATLEDFTEINLKRFLEAADRVVCARVG